MTYEEAINWLETPGGRSQKKADKEAFSDLMAALGDPQEKLRFVHVTGSNGKGSICTMLAEILSRSGLRTGLYTSPHLSVYNERCRVNGQNIPDADLARLLGTVRDETERSGLSFGLFYKMTAAALLFFAEQNCDIVVLEVGRGGRRDCTNIVRNTLLSIIGSVSLEHTEVLGHTVAEIAAEKSGIFKPGGAALMLRQSEEAMDAASRKAAELRIPLLFTDPEKLRTESRDEYGQVISYRERSHLKLSCPGPYQTENVQIVLDAADILKEKGLPITEAAVREALASLDWPGRFETLREKPQLLIDGAHNIGAVRALAEGLKNTYPGERFTFILTLLWDRPWQEMIEMIKPLACRFIAVETDDPKALHSGELAQYLRQNTCADVTEAPNEEQALRKALSLAGKEDRICVFGSIYLAGMIWDLYLQHYSE